MIHNLILEANPKWSICYINTRGNIMDFEKEITRDPNLFTAKKVQLIQNNADFPLLILWTLNKCCVKTSFLLNFFWHSEHPNGLWSECDAAICRFRLVICWILLKQIGHLNGCCWPPWSDLQCCSYVVRESKLRPHSQ